MMYTLYMNLHYQKEASCLMSHIPLKNEQVKDLPSRKAVYICSVLLWTVVPEDPVLLRILQFPQHMIYPRIKGFPRINIGQVQEKITHRKTMVRVPLPHKLSVSFFIIDKNFGNPTKPEIRYIIQYYKHSSKCLDHLSDDKF